MSKISSILPVGGKPVVVSVEAIPEKPKACVIPQEKVGVPSEKPKTCAPSKPVKKSTVTSEPPITAVTQDNNIFCDEICFSVLDVLTRLFSNCLEDILRASGSNLTRYKQGLTAIREMSAKLLMAEETNAKRLCYNIEECYKYLFHVFFKKTNKNFGAHKVFIVMAPFKDFLTLVYADLVNQPDITNARFHQRTLTERQFLVGSSIRMALRELVKTGLRIRDNDPTVDFYDNLDSVSQAGDVGERADEIEEKEEALKSLEVKKPKKSPDTAIIHPAFIQAEKKQDSKKTKDPETTEPSERLPITSIVLTAKKEYDKKPPSITSDSKKSYTRPTSATGTLKVEKASSISSIKPVG